MGRVVVECVCNVVGVVTAANDGFAAVDLMVLVKSIIELNNKNRVQTATTIIIIIIITTTKQLSISKTIDVSEYHKTASGINRTDYSFSVRFAV
jgi:hypothetical protein